MDSAIARAIRSQYEPVALVFSDELPDGAMQFAEGKWGCVMWLLLAAAAKGKPAAADRTTFGCLGGGTGLGFGNQYETWPGGIECFYRFLSTGQRPTGGRRGRPVDPARRRQRLRTTASATSRPRRR